MAEMLKGAGYDTAYIGKWHLDGHGRDSYIPPERRLIFGVKENTVRLSAGIEPAENLIAEYSGTPCEKPQKRGLEPTLVIGFNRAWDLLME